ncbi:MAG: carbon-nitrogen family hydrolase [Verrucomicrobiales bacterium]|nr:carbon-nitrogen family hydrolase [Verrucomicrobiales bacterium]
MHVVGFQNDIAWEDRQSNFSRIDASAAASSDIGVASLLVFPELSTCGFSMNPGRTAEPKEGESFQFFSQLAKKHQSYVIAGLAVESDKPGLGANEAVCFAPAGEEIARYRKMHPFPLVEEEKHYPAGSAPVVFPIGEWTVSTLICYDLRFPEPFRRATAMGAELFVVIANWPIAREDHWLTLLRARAIENQAYVVGVNRSGTDPTLTYPGSSLIVGPKGETIAHAGREPGLITADLNREELLQWRRDFPAITPLLPTNK